MTKKSFSILVICTIIMLVIAFFISYAVVKYHNKEINADPHIVEHYITEATETPSNIPNHTIHIPEDRVYRREVAFDEIKEISGWQDWACNRFLDTMEAGGIETVMILMGSNNESNINIVTFAVYSINGEVYEVHTNYPYCSIKSIEKDHEVIYENGKYLKNYKITTTEASK